MSRTSQPRFVRALSARPATAVDAVIHHGARVLLLLAVAAGILLLFPVAPIADFPVLESGMVAERDIIANIGFPIRKSETELARERSQAALSTPPVYDFDAGAADTVMRRTREFIAALDRAASAGTEAQQRDALRRVLSESRLPSGDDAVQLLQNAQNRAILAAALQRSIAAEMPRGVAPAELSALQAAQVRIRQGETERIASTDSVPTANRFFDRATRYLPLTAPRGMGEMQRLVLIRFFAPTLKLNARATDEARRSAQAAVPLVKGRVLAGERIIAAHEKVTDEDVERLQAYEAELTRLGQMQPGHASPARTLGALLFNALVLSVFGLLLYTYRAAAYHNFRHIVILSALALGVVAVTAVIDRADAPVELIPIAFPALVVAMLWDGRMALTIALVLSLLLSGQTPFLGISALFPMVLGGAAAALSARVIRRRAQMWVYIAILAGAYIAAAVTIGLLRARTPDEVFWSALWGTLNGAGSVFVAMGFIPVLENFARITTDQTLLELADLNGPLLKRLSLEAPGTYAHSISVANLAEAAANRIGASALLARVGSYYHDVGKLSQSQYYIENQPPGRNPHDVLKPAASAAIVRSHVLEGLRLSDQYRLPQSVRAFIEEHHGTQPITYFLDRARKDEGADVDVDAFIYPGPKPQTRETAIVMLADSVESASRVLDDPTPDSVRELVNRIVDTKIGFGQLDDAPLTLRDLAQVKDAFVRVISGMYHHRIDYPALRPDAARRTEAPATRA